MQKDFLIFKKVNDINNKKSHENVTDKNILNKWIKYNNWLDPVLYGENNTIKDIT